MAYRGAEDAIFGCIDKVTGRLWLPHDFYGAYPAARLQTHSMHARIDQPPSQGVFPSNQLSLLHGDG